MMMMSLLADHLHQFDCEAYTYDQFLAPGTPFENYKAAAVLIPLMQDDDGTVKILLTQRAVHLRHDGGHVAFPGGKRDDHETSSIETALREAEEEIGLPKDSVKVCTRLPPRINARKTVIFPIIGIIPNDFKPEPNPNEVQAVFILPLSRFLNGDRHHTSGYTSQGIQHSIHFFEDNVDSNRYMTWGLTASIVIDVAVAYCQRVPDFPLAPGHSYKLQDPFQFQKTYLDTFVKAETISLSKL